MYQKNRAGVVLQQVKLLLETPATHSRVLAKDPAAPGEAAEGVSGTCAPDTYMGDLEGIQGSWLWFSPALAVADIWEMKQPMEDVSLPLFLSLSL